MSIKKQYLKSKPVCKVTLTLPKKVANGAKTVSLVGEFNDWDSQATPMKQLKDGTFKTTLDLPSNHEYQFRYLLDGEKWENDWEADKYTNNGISGEDNSVMVL